MLKYLLGEESGIIHNNQRVLMQGGGWNKSPERPLIAHSGDTSVPDGSSAIVLVQIEDGAMAIQNMQEGPLSWPSVDDYIIFKLFDGMYKDGFVVSHVTWPTDSVEGNAFVLGGEGENVNQMRESAK